LVDDDPDGLLSGKVGVAAPGPETGRDESAIESLLAVGSLGGPGGLAVEPFGFLVVWEEIMSARAGGDGGSGNDLLHCCWSANHSRSTKPSKTLAKTVSERDILLPSVPVKRMMYAGVVMRKSRTLWAREMKSTLKTKKSGAGILVRRTSLMYVS
jgi:hypothetical protein